MREGVEEGARSSAITTGKIDCLEQSDSTSKVRLRRKMGLLQIVYRAVSAVSPRRIPTVCPSHARNRLGPSNFGKVSLAFGIGRPRSMTKCGGDKVRRRPVRTRHRS